MGVGAALGVAVIGGIKGSSDAKKAESAARDAANGLKEGTSALIDVNQGYLDDWEDMFGGIEQNLNDYYQNLDADKYATQYKTNLNEDIDKQMTQMNETMAAQGIQTSGMKSQAMKEASFAKATGSAEIDMAAEDQVAQMQAGYLGQYEGRRSTAIGDINQITAGGLEMQYNADQAIANTYSQSSQGWYSMGGSALGAGLGGDTGGLFSGMFSSGGGGMNPGQAGGGGTDAFKNWQSNY